MRWTRSIYPGWWYDLWGFEQGCGSAFIFCGSGSSCIFNADPDPAVFSMRIRIRILIANPDPVGDNECGSMRIRIHSPGSEEMIWNYMDPNPTKRMNTRISSEMGITEYLYFRGCDPTWWWCGPAGRAPQVGQTGGRGWYRSRDTPIQHPPQLATRWPDSQPSSHQHIL